MEKSTKKASITMLVILAVLFAIIFIYKAIGGYFAGKAMAANASAPITVSVTKVQYQQWQPHLEAVGSLRAVQGVNVTTELAGLVRTIYFDPGIIVKKGDLLVELNIDTDVAQLHSLQAQADLAAINYRRDQAQYAITAISKAVLDTSLATLQSNQAQVEQQTATIAKKLIRAPFSGRLGVSAVNPGQYLNPGDTVVNLQALDPIYVDFYLPQQMLAKIAIGQQVRLTSDTYPNKIFVGRITTIEPLVDVATRNVKVEATLANPDFKLYPGMFAIVNVLAGQPEKYLTLPQSAVAFNPYGEIVYIVQRNKPQGKDTSSKQSELTVRQSFVTVGETRGDQIVILKGLKEGDEVVTAGQLKLRNGSKIVINNQITPGSSAHPVLPANLN